MLVITEVPDSDESRRESLYKGAVFAMGATAASAAFSGYAWDLIREAFDPLDPETAQDQLKLEDFVAIVADLKPRYTHSARAKELLRELLASYGCDTAETYFDLPKLRIVTHSGFLTAGVGYAYKAHRDVWYSCPPCQSNWWTPIRPIVSECSLAFFPKYWEQEVANNSDGFDAFEWNANGRATAAAHVKKDTRNHPTLVGTPDLGEEVRIVGGPASMLNFSAAQLHATVPNSSGRTRFSIDFRTANIHDLAAQRGAQVIDSGSTGSTIYDFLRADDLAPVPESVVALYNTRTDASGALVYTPVMT